MNYFAIVFPGLERLAAAEIRERLRDAEICAEGYGLVRFCTSESPRRLLRLGLPEDVFVEVAVIAAGKQWAWTRRIGRQVADPARLAPAVEVLHQAGKRSVRRITFRVVAQRVRGEFAYPRRAIREEAVRAVQRAFPRWKPLAEDAHLELWIRQDRDQVVAGLRLSDRTMRHRRYKRRHLPASLRPTVARALVRLTRPRPNDRFLDPTCGAGTVLAERALEAPCRFLLGGDLSVEALAAARENLAGFRAPWFLYRGDTRQLPLPDDSVDAIACNPPFGKRLGDPIQSRALYRGLLREARRALVASGRLALLVGRRRLLEGALRHEEPWEILETHRCVVLGEPAHLLLLRPLD